ncbi:hypothetical protein SLE2022_146750 [Rubroshorea leprosula]
MADSFCEIGGYTELYVKILLLEELMETTRKNIEKLMEESRQEGTADDLKEAARDNNEKLEDLSQNFLEFKRDFVYQAPGPSELEPYRKRFQEFSDDLNGIDQRVRGNLLVLEVIQEPTEVNEAEEEHHRSPDLLETKEPQASSDAAGQAVFGNLGGNTLLQPDGQAMEKFYHKKIQEKAPASRYGKQPSPPKNPTRKLSLAAAAAEVRIEGKKKMQPFNLLPSGANWNLCDTIMDTYGFVLKEAQEIEMQVAKAFTQNPYQGIGSSIGERLLDWKGVWKVKETLQESKSKSERVQSLIPGLLKIWIFRVENQMYNLVLYLRSIMSGYQAAMAKFQQLRNSCGEHKRRNNGKVPIIVHRIVGLLEMQVPGGQSELNRYQQEALYKNCGFDRVIGSFHLMILRLTFVLDVSGDANNTRRISPNVVERCEQELGKLEGELNGIERRIMEGKENVQKKRKREDEVGGNGSGRGTGSLKMGEKGRGKMVWRDY